MSDPRDEDEAAYHWAGDDVGGRSGDHLARGSRESVRDFSPSAPEDGAAVRQSAGGAVLTGLFGVLYLALTVGWILGTQYTSAGTTQLLPQVLWQFGEFTAIIAAPIWFGATLLLTPRQLGVRIGFLLLGLGVLLPWPVLPLLVVGS